MLLLIHISIALISIVQATVSVFSPSSRKLQVSYGLIAATLLSGAYLVYVSRSPVLQACTTGVMYLAVTLGLAYAAQRRLAYARVPGRDI